jgi:hypothetical protein
MYLFKSRKVKVKREESLEAGYVMNKNASVKGIF